MDLKYILIAVLVVLLIVFISGYIIQTTAYSNYVNEKEMELTISKSQLTSMGNAYASCYDSLEQKNKQILGKNILLDICSKDLANCSYTLENYVCEGVVINCETVKYSHGCEDVPNTVVYNKQSHYPCYWEFREMYKQYGQYVDVGTVCMTQNLGWDFACACTQQMAGDVYAQDNGMDNLVDLNMG